MKTPCPPTVSLVGGRREEEKKNERVWKRAERGRRMMDRSGQRGEGCGDYLHSAPVA